MEIKNEKVLENALNQFDKFPIPLEPVEELNLLSNLRKEKIQRIDLSNIDAIFIQHHLGPYVARMRAMFEDGLKPDRSWYLDIPYSTHSMVIKALQDFGCPMNHFLPKFDNPLENYSRMQARRVEEVMRKVINRDKPHPLLVVDDGAYFFRYLNSVKNENPKLLDSFKNTSVVEQTTRGHRYIVNHALELIKLLDISLVTIAKCKTKIAFEGPFIGAAISRALLKNVDELLVSQIENIAIIGFGPVGKATLQEILRRKPDAKIDIIDIDPDSRELATSLSENCTGLPQLNESKKYDLIFGCTGYNSFQLDQRKLLADEAILSSGSSAAIEFNRAGFIELADRYSNDEIEVLDRDETIKQGLHTKIKIQKEGGHTFSFLNAGFPINFDGSLECLPDFIIQATHCLLYYAGVQSIEQRYAGVNTIDPDMDNWIYENAFKDLKTHLVSSQLCNVG